LHSGREPDILPARKVKHNFIGRGYGNLLSYGAFELDNAGTTKLFQDGRIVGGAATDL